MRWRMFGTNQDPDDWRDQVVDREREEQERKEHQQAETMLQQKEVFDKVLKQIFNP